MKNCKNILSKVWFLATVLIVLAGIVLLSVLGFNNTVDYSKGYELTIGVDQKTDNLDLIPTVSENFFDENGISPKKYSKVFLNDGAYVVYKFDEVIELDKESLILELETALDNKFVEVSAEFKEIKVYKNSNTLSLALALIITAVVVFLFVLIFGKARIALTTIFASVVSVLSYLGMVSLFRIPVCNFLGVFTSLAFAFSIGLTALITFKFKGIQKLVSNEKMPLCDVASLGLKESLIKFVVLMVAVLLASLGLLIFGTPYLKILALHLLVASVASFATALIGAPSVWALEK